jgi:type VI secretion system protein ImpH
VASTYRKPGAGLDTTSWNLRRLLEDQPFSVEFFKAVQLLECLYPERQPVGLFAPPSQEVVRFHVHTRLGFPASDVQSIHWPPEGQPLMSVNFLGLTGPNGVLPHLYTLLLIERRYARDRRLQEFLDVFHHRIISLYYQAWRKYRVAAGYGSGGHRVTWYLRDMAGIGTKGMEDRQEVPDRSLLYFAGFLALQPRSATAFEHLLQEYFGVPVEIHQFTGAWYDLPLDAQCELIDEEDAPRQLGLGAVAGDQIWDHSSKARIRIGPLTLARYREFLPGTSTHNALRALARFYTGGQIDFDVQLVLAREQVPEYELGAEGEAELPLGLCSWAKTGEFEHDPDDAILSLGDEAWV